MLIESKVIAEAWDAAGLYGVGQFISKSDRFAEWNGPFRDDLRRFVKGDGSNDNYSWNCGVEGATDQPEIEALRLRQIKNLLTLLFLSQGTPMLLMGDEVRRSQQGNNNAYCQDNEISWFNWNDLEKHGDVFRFVQQLIRFTQSLQLFAQGEFLSVDEHPHQPYLIWHGVKLGQPDWGSDSRTLAFMLCHPQAQEQLHVIFNAYWDTLTFELPPPLASNHRWHRIIDTAQPTLGDFCNLDNAPMITQLEYPVMPRSSVVFMTR